MIAIARSGIEALAGVPSIIFGLFGFALFVVVLNKLTSGFRCVGRPGALGLHDRAALAEIVQRSLEGAALWDEVKDILTQSGLALSGGKQQRLCIARPGRPCGRRAGDRHLAGPQQIGGSVSRRRA